MLRRWARVAALLALITVTAGCEMSVTVQTRIDANGGGELSIAMGLDQELRDGLTQIAETDASRDDLASIDAAFDRLASLGWTIVRTEPANGLLLRASKRFADPSGLRAALDELRAPSDGDVPSFGDLGLEIDYDVTSSFLRTTAELTGRMDLGGAATLDPRMRSLQDVIGDLVRFEVRADLPGEVAVRDGRASVTENGVVWRPRLGETVRFGATSSALKLGPLLAVMFPLLGLLAFGGMFATTRRKRKALPFLDVEVVANQQTAEDSDTEDATATADATVALDRTIVADVTVDDMPTIDLTEQPIVPGEPAP